MTVAAPPIRTRRQVTAKTHAPDGSKTISQIDREHVSWLDRQPIVTRCAVEGCDWPGFTGPAGEAREAARAHRADAHPELPQVARKPKRPKPVKPSYEQTAADVEIVRKLDRGRRRVRSTTSRRAGNRPPARRSLLTPERLEHARRLFEAERLSCAEIARRHAAEWGYGSVAACVDRLRQELKRAGVELHRPAEPRRRPAPKPRPNFLRDRFDELRARYEDGDESIRQIGQDVYVELGYKTLDSFGVAFGKALREAGVFVNRGRGNYTRGTERRGGIRPFAKRRIRGARLETLVRLQAAGIGVQAIAAHAWQRWGYVNDKACASAIYTTLGKAGIPAVAMRANSIPELNRAQALALLDLGERVFAGELDADVLEAAA